MMALPLMSFNNRPLPAWSWAIITGCLWLSSSRMVKATWLISAGSGRHWLTRVWWLNDLVYLPPPTRTIVVTNSHSRITQFDAQPIRVVQQGALGEVVIYGDLVVRRLLHSLRNPLPQLP